MASGKSLELAAIARPEPVVVVAHPGTNRAQRRHYLLTTTASTGPRQGTPKDISFVSKRARAAMAK